MTYKKQLQKFTEDGQVTNGEIIDFVTGKGHLRLPNWKEISELVVLISDKSTDGDDPDFVLDIPDKLDHKKRKDSIDYLKAQLSSFKPTKKSILQLWNLCKDERKRKLIIAAVAAGALLIIGGTTIAIVSMMKKKDKDVDIDDASSINDDVSDVDIYTDDIPQVDIDDTEI